MDGIGSSTNILVLATCNYVSDVPEALLRPGRLDRKIEFPFPDGTYCRRSIVNGDSVPIKV